jgi:hypothetical protein
MIVVITKIFNSIILLTIAALSDFSKGFWYGVIVTLTLSFIISLVGRYWKKISAIFKATRVPATNPGPSPIQKMGGCILSLAILVLLILVAAVILQVVLL